MSISTASRLLIIASAIFTLSGCSAALSSQFIQRAAINSYLQKYKGGPKCIQLGWDTGKFYINQSDDNGGTVGADGLRYFTPPPPLSADTWDAKVPDEEPAPQTVRQTMQALVQIGFATTSRTNIEGYAASRYALTTSAKKYFYNMPGSAGPLPYLCFQRMQVASIIGEQPIHEEVNGNDVQKVMRVKFTWKPAADETPNSQLRSFETSIIGSRVPQVATFIEQQNGDWGIADVEDE